MWAIGIKTLVLIPVSKLPNAYVRSICWLFLERGLHHRTKRALRPPVCIPALLETGVQSLVYHHCQNPTRIFESELGENSTYEDLPPLDARNRKKSITLHIKFRAKAIKSLPITLQVEFRAKAIKSHSLPRDPVQNNSRCDFTCDSNEAYPAAM